MKLRITTEKFSHRSIRTTLTSVSSVVREWIKIIQHKYAYILRQNRLIVGLGIRFVDKTAVSLQLSVGCFCLVFQLSHAESVPETLRKFLSNPFITFIGVCNERDAALLASSKHELEVTNLIDVRKVIPDRLKCRSGEGELLLGVILKHRNTDIWKSDWSSKVLTKEQVRLACLETCICLLWGIAFDSWRVENKDQSKDAVVATTCSFLYGTLSILTPACIIGSLSYIPNFFRILWNSIKECHSNQNWSCFSENSTYLPSIAPGWLLPLAVFFPIYKHMLELVFQDCAEEFKLPLSTKEDIEWLIVILRKTLCQVLYLELPPSYKSVRLIQCRVSVAGAELMAQLHEWNIRHQFAPSSAFEPDGHVTILQDVAESNIAHDVLKQAPFLVPLKRRVQIFNSQVSAAKIPDCALYVRITVRRDRIFEDAFRQMSTLSKKSLKGKIQVTYINEHGIQEQGFGVGLFKDFMETIIQKAFSSDFGLFKETSEHLLYPNPGSAIVHEHEHLQYFHFLGTLLAKAMFEGILVDVPFASFFLKKLQKKYNNLNDLRSLDHEVYRHLFSLKQRDDVSTLGLYFSIQGEHTEEDLQPGGKNLLVTNENLNTYIHLIADYRLNTQIRQQTSHFIEGFQKLIHKDWIDIFSENELQLIISGSPDGFDLDDLRSSTIYLGGYHRDHDVIKMLWEVLKSFSTENKRKFLKFVTGCSRGPVLGFSYLIPSFCIQGTGGEASHDRLPTSATCMNMLKLPPYPSKELMEEKLLYSIKADAGFLLS